MFKDAGTVDVMVLDVSERAIYVQQKEKIDR
jgi:hypothetical protein